MTPSAARVPLDRFEAAEGSRITPGQRSYDSGAVAAGMMLRLSGIGWLALWFMRPRDKEQKLRTR
jgi:hypothetical protein